MPFGFLGLFVPAIGQVFDGARLLGTLENRKRRAHDGGLGSDIVHVSVGSAKRMFDGGDAGHPDEVLIRPDHVQGNGRNACGFDYARDQSHGPAAIRSDRGEEE